MPPRKRVAPLPDDLPVPTSRRRTTLSEFEKVFGTKTGRGTVLTKDQAEAEKRRKAMEAKRKAEAVRRADAVLRYRHEAEWQGLYENEYEYLRDDSRFVLGELDR